MADLGQGVAGGGYVACVGCNKRSVFHRPGMSDNYLATEVNREAEIGKL